MRFRSKFAALLAAACTLSAGTVHAQMVKFTAIWEVPGDNALLDQWYRRTHSQETLEAVGPWLTRYWTYRALAVPPEVAQRFNVVSYRLTEMWYDSIA